MAIPRVFVSSTCYDLKQIRQDIKSFIESLGYLPVLSDQLGVTYNATPSLEEDCYHELPSCEVVIGIVGGRFGTESKGNLDKSISMTEMEKAIELNKQMYIFIEKKVNIEFDTYLVNKGNNGFNYAQVDDVKIFEFIEKLKSKNNIIINDFSTTSDIVECLRSQWAGLFQTFLKNKEELRQSEGLLTMKNIVADLTSISEKLDKNRAEIVSSCESMFVSDEIIKQTINPVLVEISNELMGHGNGILFVKSKGELHSFIEIILNYSNGDNGSYTFNDDRCTLTIDWDFICDKDKKLIYKTQKDINLYKEEKGKSFVNIFENQYTEVQAFDDDLPF